jgi:prolyl 4-hydroxylase
MSSSSSVSITSIVQYAVFAIVAYVLAGAPLQSVFFGSNNGIVKEGLFSGDKIESLMHPDPNLQCEEHGYKTHIFHRDPLVIYIENFLTPEESNHILQISEPNWKPSSIWTDGVEHLDETVRKSSKAPLPAEDPVIACLSERARTFQGWRPSVFIEKLWSQRYTKSGHYMYHYDFSNPSPRSGRVSTFMVYADANCTGGGTNFPRISAPASKDWCRFIECEEEGLTDGAGGTVEGVVFKAIKGNAVFWENLRGDGSGYQETWHAGLPVKEGVKVGLNIWSWFQEGYTGGVAEQEQGKEEA